LPYLIKQEDIYLFISRGEFIDIGTPEDYEKAKKMFKV